jgi:RNA polymerase sigma-70 factor (ECF subfamily)
MLGSVTEAEDVLQEAYLRFQAAPPGTVRSPGAFLTTVVSRLCLDVLKSARRQRETYIGPWLPEPLVTDTPGDAGPLESALLDESISMAFLVLLERLTPAERAAFLLREVFEYDYAEIAAIIGRGEAACRQLVHRAKASLAANRPRFEVDLAAGERLARGFVQAVRAGDLAGLTAMLTEDVTLWADGGGKTAAALNPIHGADRVARLTLALLSKVQPEAVSIAYVPINNEPGLIVRVDGVITWAAALTVTADGRVSAVRSVANPEKLAHLGVVGRDAPIT